MAGFSMISLSIQMTTPPGSYGGPLAELAQIPTLAAPTISFAHEYVHFLQLLSELMGFRLLGELIDLGIKGALVLEGIVDPKGGTVLDQSYVIYPLLEKQADHVGRGVPQIGERIQSIVDELNLLFGIDEHPYSGGKQAGEFDTCRVAVGTYSDEFFGVVTPRGRFRPFNLAMLAEGMARRIDRWLNANHGFGHDWTGADPVTEAEVYDGIRTILSAPRYAHNITTGTLDRVTVIVCTLALATPRPDHAVRAMLDRLGHGVSLGLLPRTVGLELARVLIREGLLDAKHYNEVMSGIMHDEPSKSMNRREFYEIYKHLGRIQIAANYALSQPDYFADDSVTWSTVRSWMTTHSVPRVFA